jgi:chloramphenicol O-acetyltransferase type A
MEDPLCGVTVRVDCTRSYNEARERGISFFLHYLYNILVAVDRLEEMHYRIVDGKVYRYDRIDAGPTIGREDGTFGAGYFVFYSNEDRFISEAEKEISRVKSAEGMALETHGEDPNLIFFSAVPWFDFSDMKHPVNPGKDAGCTRISTGKLSDVIVPEGFGNITGKSTDGLDLRHGAVEIRKQMSMNITFHHGLMDGYVVNEFLKELARFF